MSASQKETDSIEDKKLIRTTGRLMKQTADKGDHCVLCGLPEDDLQMINELCARDTDYQLLETICSNRFHIQITEPIVTTHCLLHLPSPLFHTWMLSHRFHEQTKEEKSDNSHSLLKRDSSTVDAVVVPSGGVDVRLLASQLVDDAFRTVANNPGIVSPAVGLQAAHFLKAVEEAERDRREKEASKESDSWEVAYNTLVEACQSVLDEDMMRVLGEKVEQLMNNTDHVEET
ncbi:MAG: hypothetical protein J5965_21995 [Aeriscardovia sp.]|nr:hypothetical protein [Aeriscardovia sp.]